MTIRSLLAVSVLCAATVQAFVVRNRAGVPAQSAPTTFRRMFESEKIFSSSTTSNTRLSSTDIDDFDGYISGNAQKVATKDLVVGSGAVPEYGNIVKATYKGKLMASDQIFDEGIISYKKGFKDCMPGFEEGMEGLKEGGKRIIRVPPAFAYGEKGSKSGTVPPNADLEFEVELESVSSGVMADFMHSFGIGKNRKTAGLAAILVLLAVSPMLSQP